MPDEFKAQVGKIVTMGVVALLAIVILLGLTFLRNS
jgi:hypothetical protein